jgi:hypothetical protein
LLKYRAPRKRRRTLPGIDYLRVYLKVDEKMDALRIGLDPTSISLLRLLSIEEDVQEATWFSVLAHRLLTEPELKDRIAEYGAKEYQNLPAVSKGVYIFRNYTIPTALKDTLSDAAKSLAAHRLGSYESHEDKRGVTGPWLRIALCYCAFQEKQWKYEEIPPMTALPD